jgi:hypothetical protein
MSFDADQVDTVRRVVVDHDDAGARLRRSGPSKGPETKQGCISCK